MTLDSTLPGYNYRESYEWNYHHAPPPSHVEVADVGGEWEFFGRKISSPLGVAAGPLLNGGWILYYASLGFDVLTYKTVRSVEHECYPMPNLQPVTLSSITGQKSAAAAREMAGSWAVSFGMPSRAPEIWRADVEQTRELLPKNKILSVSIVASPQADWSLEQLAEDYAQLAQWAVASGADCVEANFSCPNVQSADGQLYQQPEIATMVAARIRQKAGHIPVFIKVGHITDENLAGELVAGLTPFVDGIVMVNCIAAEVTDASGGKMFNQEKRGIAGKAISKPVLEQIRLFNRVIKSAASNLKLIGVGGIGTTRDVSEHLRAGCCSVQLATAAMLNPRLGLEIREQLRSGA